MGCHPICEGDKHVGWVCTGSGQKYQARTRYEGHKLYDLVGKPTRSYPAALRRMTEAFIAGEKQGIKRADVIMSADYYDPVVLCELRRV